MLTVLAIAAALVVITNGIHLAGLVGLSAVMRRQQVRREKLAMFEAIKATKREENASPPPDQPDEADPPRKTEE